MERIEFLIQGSAPDPYVITFLKKGQRISFNCSCPAGEHNLLCKHLLRIISGIQEGIVSNNSLDVSKVHAWIANTEIGITAKEITECQNIIDFQQIRLKKLKKKLFRIIQD